MKHYSRGTDFSFHKEPIQGFVCELSFGRNKRARYLLPSEVEPVDSCLPEGRFRLAQTQSTVYERPEYRILKGEDLTDRVLAFLGIAGGFRGGCGVHPDTTARILAKVEAGNACESECQVIALMEPGQKVVFSSHGRDGKYITMFVWTLGGEVKETRLSLKEYEVWKNLGREELEVI